MPRRPTPPKPESAQMSKADIERGIRRLKKRLEAVVAFDPNTLDRQDPYSTTRPLEVDIETALVETFGHSTIEYYRFSGAAQFDWPIFIGGEIPHQDKIKEVAEDRQRSIQLLSSAISLLEERLADIVPVTTEAVAAKVSSKRIFIVHGRDNEPKEAVARFLESLGYEPIILHEQPNRGRTIIQKFREEASDVGFAIVLMTPDDEMPNGDRRARQNVILELGFFLGKLGPERVAALVKGKLETPSDFDGVVYIQFDSGWKLALAKELQVAGFAVDWNVVMR